MTSSSTTPTGLSADQLASFHENGFLVVPNYLSPQEVRTLLSTTDELLDSFDLASHPLTRFTTDDEKDEKDEDNKHVGDDYFLTSGDKVRFFFEPDAFTTNGSGGSGSGDDSSRPTLKTSKASSINKIGHALHSRSPPFSAATLSVRTRAVARSLGYADPRVLQSMVICKQPRIGARVPPHIDSEFLYTDPPSAVGWWIALQDANSQNGSLGFWKGSHRLSGGNRVKRRFVRRKDGKGTEFVGWDESQGGCLPKNLQQEETDDENLQQEKDEDEHFELLDVPAGALVLIHGNVLHTSERNTGDRSRFAYTFHVIEGASGWEYDGRNWLQPPEGGFTKLYQE